MTDYLKMAIVRNSDVLHVQEEQVSREEATYQDGNAQRIKAGYYEQDGKYFRVLATDEDLPSIGLAAQIAAAGYAKKAHFWIAFWSVLQIIFVVLVALLYFRIR